MRRLSKHETIEKQISIITNNKGFEKWKEMLDEIQNSDNYLFKKRRNYYFFDSKEMNASTIKNNFLDEHFLNSILEAYENKLDVVSSN